jgi:hypothetical protein
LIGILIGVLIPLSVFYTNTLTSKTEETSEEGNTTIIRIYRRYVYVEGPSAAEVEQVPVGYPHYFLDVEHRIYPESINVPYGAEKTLMITYTLDIETSGEWDVRLSTDLSEDQELTVEVPRTPSGCYIRSELVFTSATSFEVTIKFGNPSVYEGWNVGRPLVKVLHLYLGYPSSTEIGTPDVEVTIEAWII